MREKELEVMTQSPLLLSDESKTFVCDLWENELMKLEEPLPTKIRDLISFLITNSDIQGVFFGTVEELARKSKISISQTRNGLRIFEKAKLIERRHGITIIIDRRVYPNYE